MGDAVIPSKEGGINGTNHTGRVKEWRSVEGSCQGSGIVFKGIPVAVFQDNLESDGKLIPTFKVTSVQTCKCKQFRTTYPILISGQPEFSNREVFSRNGLCQGFRNSVLATGIVPVPDIHFHEIKKVSAFLVLFFQDDPKEGIVCNGSVFKIEGNLIIEQVNCSQDSPSLFVIYNLVKNCIPF